MTENAPSPPPPRRAGAARATALVAAGLLVGGGLVFALVDRSGSSGAANNASAAVGSLAGGPPSGGNGGFGFGGVAGEQHIQGTIAGKTATTVTVKSTSGTATYTVNATTEIVRNGQSATLGSVEVGDPVLVHVYPSSSGRMMVERLFAGTLPSGYGAPPPVA